MLYSEANSQVLSLVKQLWLESGLGAGDIHFDGIPPIVEEYTNDSTWLYDGRAPALLHALMNPGERFTRIEPVVREANLENDFQLTHDIIIAGADSVQVRGLAVEYLARRYGFPPDVVYDRARLLSLMTVQVEPGHFVRIFERK